MNPITVFEALETAYSLVKAFFGPTSTSIEKYLNVPELLRIIGTTIIASLAGGLGFAPIASAVLSALLSDATTIFPGDAALATAVLTAVVEIVRRLGHGLPAPTPTPAT